MASYLAQVGTNLWKVTIGGVATQITLPANIALTGSSNPCRFCVFTGGATPIIVVVNGGTHDFYIDWTGVARKVQISAPATAPALTAGTGAGLTGVYKVAVSFKIKDANGMTIQESAIGPISLGSASLVNQSLALSSITVSSEPTVNARGIYRTLSGGTTLYPWFDLDDNTTLTDDRTGADSSLSLLPANSNQNSAPPDLKLIAQWNDALWGVPRIKPDSVRWTEPRNFFSWSVTNELIAAPAGVDLNGITALIPRRNDLGVAKRKRFYHITGFSDNTYQRTGISETIGCVSAESVVVNRNIAYFMGERGIVQWDDEGIRYISDEQVRDWFQTDTFFNRTLFPSSQGRYNPDTDSIEWTVALVGSSTLDHWIAFQLPTRTWMGPHKTDAFTPSCFANGSEFRGSISDTNQLPLCVMGGSNGVIYKRDTTRADDDGTAVAMSVDLPTLSGNEPDLNKVWGNITIHTRLEQQGLITLTPTVGDLSNPAGQPSVHDLRKERELMPRPDSGVGRYLQLTLAHSSLSGEQPRIYGIEIPYTYLGRR